MKKILLVSNGFYPENSPRSFRATELAKELVLQGHYVKVISHQRGDVVAFCKQHGIDFKDMGPYTWKAPQWTSNRFFQILSRVVTRIGMMFLEYPTIQLLPMVKKALRDEQGYDALISVAVPYPIHWGVAAAWNTHKPIAKKWLADCGDPYMGQENDSFKPAFYFKYVEKWFCKKADYIVVPTEKSRGGYYPEFQDKIKVIPQGFKVEDVLLQTTVPDPSPIIFGYGGMFIPKRRDPTELLTYLCELPEEFAFEFHIFTQTPALVEPFVARSKGRIRLHSPVPRLELLYVLSGMHFVVNFENVGTTQTPSKLIDYLILNKPVLSVRYGALSQHQVDSFLQGNYKESMVLPNLDTYRIENVAKAFLQLMK